MRKKENLPDFSKLCKPEQNTIWDIVSFFIFLFFTASVLGYVWEVLIFLVKEHAFYNRGFLYGPWLPVYGIGAVLFSILLPKEPFSVFTPTKRVQKNHPCKVFVLSALLGSGLELFIGWFLDTVWQLHYWDYSGYFLNFHGYICLASTVGFGIAGIVLVCLFLPALQKMWFHFSADFRKGLNTVLIFLFVFDCTAALIFPNIGNGFTF